MARKQSDTGIFCQHGLCDGQALTGRAAAGWAEREERLSRSRKQKPKRYQDGWGMEGPDCEFAEVLAHSQAVVIAASAFLRAVWAILNNYYQLLLLMALHRCGSRGGGGGGKLKASACTTPISILATCGSIYALEVRRQSHLNSECSHTTHALPGFDTQAWH